MKFAVVAALFAAVAAKCEPERYHTKIFNDAKCTKLNEEATKQYINVPKDQWKFYKPGCHELNGYHFTIECDEVGVTQGLFKDEKCKVPVPKDSPFGQKVTYKWDVCQKAPGQDIWFVSYRK